MRILLAVEGSECSQAAVHEVTSRPWEKGSELKILAVNAPAYPYPIPDPFLVLEGARIVWMKDERKRLETLVKETAASIASSKNGSNLKIETDVIDGTPKVVIIGEAENWDADLILIGAHGHGHLEKFKYGLGSVSQAVATHAPCSVEIVRCKQNK